MNLKLTAIVQARDALEEARKLAWSVSCGRELDPIEVEGQLKRIRDAWATLDVWIESQRLTVEVTQ